MPCGDPMWTCQHCGRTYYTANRTICDCPNSQQQTYMPYDNLIKCPCGKFYVPKGFEHQCPHCKGKKPTVQDLWAEACDAAPTWPVRLNTPTNSKPLCWPLTPKKKSIRINLPPKPAEIDPRWREQLGLKEPTLNELYDDILSEKVADDFIKQQKEHCEFRKAAAEVRQNAGAALVADRERRLREDATETAYLEKLDKEERRGENGGLDAMIEDLFEQKDDNEVALDELIEDVVEEQRRKDDLEVRSVVETFEKEARKQTLVVNLFAGPGAGKSTTAAGLFFELKSRNINCELAAEYAKDLTWEERHRTFQNQVYIFGKQHHRIFRLLGQVDVVITDSPLLLTVVYDGEKRETLKQLVYEEHRKMWTFNAFIKRIKRFNPKGRVHGFDEAKALDNMIMDALDDAGELYEVFDGTPDGTSKLVRKVLDLLAFQRLLKK